MFSILVFFIILSILVLIHEVGHFLAAKKNNVFVEEFGFGLPPRIFGKKFGETLYSINALPFGGFVKLLGEEEQELKGKKLSDDLKKRTFTSKTHLQKAVILVAGVTMNFILGWGVLTFLFTQGVPVPTDKVTVSEISPKSPAANAGLAKNDVLKRIQYQGKTYSIDTPTDLITLTKKFAGKEISIVVQRGNNEFEKILTPRVNPPKGQGSMGVAISNIEVKKYPWYTAPYHALIESFVITKTIAQEILGTLFRFVTFQKVTADIAGPIGVAKLTDQAVKYGYIAVLQLLGLLSFNLAIVNILPFPSLDGGRLAMVIIEWVTRRKINAQIENKLNFFGFAILISLILLITVNDIVKLFVK